MYTDRQSLMFFIFHKGSFFNFLPQICKKFCTYSRHLVTILFPALSNPPNFTNDILTLFDNKQIISQIS